MKGCEGKPCGPPSLMLTDFCRVASTDSEREYTHPGFPCRAKNSPHDVHMIWFRR